MKRVFISMLCAGIIGLSTNPASAFYEDDGMAMIADVVIARPACLAATAVGTAFFVVSLPFALISKSVKQTAHALVVVPAKATFTRPMGEFDSLGE